MRSRRAAVLLLIVYAALPAWAHGEDLLYIFSFVFYALPAALLLFVPWHRGPVRLLVAILLAAGAVYLWRDVLPRLDFSRISTVAEWGIMLSPTLCAFALAVVLRLVTKARAA